MPMKQAKFYRCGNKIKTLATPEAKASTQTYRSVNAAKKVSVELQLKKDGATGLGSLRVVSKLR